jgi:hypothetical protein
MPGRFDELDRMFTYHAPDEEQIESLKLIREAGLKLAQTILGETPPGPDQSAAIRKVREAVMTANAAIVLEKKP